MKPLYNSNTLKCKIYSHVTGVYIADEASASGKATAVVYNKHQHTASGP